MLLRLYNLKTARLVRRINNDLINAFTQKNANHYWLAFL
ncbi:hypothetical protein PMAN_a0571 [Pseudoalteromonas marina]|nr:hypothetical protein PMAN_a0571 [Pseudoalteromonas marina]